jgi:hydroxysqualene dehydroxylase
VSRRVAVIGGGWAGCAAAVEACSSGHHVTLFEAARLWGGRARRLHGHADDTLDNGQHILIGGYSATLGLMERVGLRLADLLHPVPLDLRFADGHGWAVPAWARHWPAPLDLLAAMGSARGWRWSERAALLRATLAWRWQGFRCVPDRSVAQLCQGLPQRLKDEMLDPLCLAALNTPPAQASAATFLRVLHDALLGPGHGPWRASTLLLPKAALGSLLPEPANAWLQARGADLRLGQRVLGLQPSSLGWQVLGDYPATQPFDAVILACPPWEAARLCASLPQPAARDWAARAQALTHQPIATVYLQVPAQQPWPGAHPMLALRTHGHPAAAQFAFHRGQLGGPAGCWALVTSAGSSDRDELARQACAQAAAQLGAPGAQVVTTVVEKRATFACTPGLVRPAAQVTTGVWAAGDYVHGPYPATLEGAVRSGLQAAQQLQR